MLYNLYMNFMRNQPQHERVILYLSKKISERQTGLKCNIKRQLFHTSRHLRGSCCLSSFIQESLKELCCSSPLSVLRGLSLSAPLFLTQISHSAWIFMLSLASQVLVKLPQAGFYSIWLFCQLVGRYKKDENENGKFEEETTQTTHADEKLASVVLG